MSELFTIGHSTHSWEKFLELLRQHRIEAVADVRSSPYSQFNPHFNRESLQLALPQQGISYVFLGEELGARLIVGGVLVIFGVILTERG